MQTLNEIYSAFKLNNSNVNRLSYETKQYSIGVGSNKSARKLPHEMWNLLDDISERGHSEISIDKKIELGFQLFETFPSYYHFLTPFYHAICNKQIIEQEQKEIIWKNFMKYLISENYYADPVSYVLWVEFFEDEETVRETWQGLVNNYSDKRSLLRLLEMAGPVPFDLKDNIYNSLIHDKKNHELIFNSLLHSAYDVFGKLDKSKTVYILSQLKIDTESENHKLLKEKLK